MSLLHSVLVFVALCAYAQARCASANVGDPCGFQRTITDSLQPGEPYRDFNLPVEAGKAGCVQSFSTVVVEACQPGALPRVDVQQNRYYARVTPVPPNKLPVSVQLTFYCDCFQQ